MNRLFIFLIQALILYIVFEQTESSNCELKERLNKAFRELPSVEEIKHHTHKTIRNTLDNLKSSTQSKRKNRETIPQLAKNIESFLQKVIPNHSLVQDLMGYITMPNPHSSKNYHK